MLPVQAPRGGRCQGNDKRNPRFRAGRGSYMKSTSVARYVMPRLFGFLLVYVVSVAHAGEETIKVGILHSLSGTMAISEAVLKDTVLMMIADQNKKGGLLGRKLEPVIVDPASDWTLYADKARELLTKEKVAVVFGCWTSAS